MQAPTFQDVLAARKRIAPHLRPTPLHRYAPLDKLIGTEVWVKHENYQPVGAFKVRGGINLISSLSNDEKARGVITASTGNHGQSIAFASRLYGVSAHICVPVGANPGKVAAIRGMGAQIIEHGERFDDAALEAQRLAHERGYRFIHSANEPLLIAGVATHTLEMLEAQPDIDTIFVPVGLGSGACGACIVASTVNPQIRVIGVQAAASRAVYDSWKSGRIEKRPNDTAAEGLSTGEAAQLTLDILRDHLAGFELVSEDEILKGVAWWVECCHTLAETAAGAVISAARSKRTELKGRKVGLICSGGNITIAQLRRALEQSLQ